MLNSREARRELGRLRSQVAVLKLIHAERSEELEERILNLERALTGQSVRRTHDRSEVAEGATG